MPRRGEGPGTPIEISNFGGIASDLHEMRIPPNQFAQLVDMRTDRTGVLELREFVKGFNTGNPRNDPVSWIHMGEWGSQGGSTDQSVFFACGRQYSDPANRSLARINRIATSNINLATGMGADVSMFKVNSNAPIDGAFFMQYLLVQNGYTPLYPITPDMTLNATDIHYEGYIGKYLLPWRKWLLLINTARSNREVMISSILRGAWWGAFVDPGSSDYRTQGFTPFGGDFWEDLGAYRIMISDDADEFITGAILWNETPVISTNKGLYRIDDNFAVWPMQKETGVVKRTMCLYHNGIVFLGDDDVYLYSSDGLHSMTRDKCHDRIFDGSLMTRNATKGNEWVCDNYDEWRSMTQTPSVYYPWVMLAPFMPTVPLIPHRGGYLKDINTPADPGGGYPQWTETWGVQESVSITLKDLLPDFDNGGAVEGTDFNWRHMSNHVRLDFLVTGMAGEEDFRTNGRISDDEYEHGYGKNGGHSSIPRPLSAHWLQFHLKYRFKAPGAGWGAYTELVYDKSVQYHRDERVLSFVIKIPAQANSDVFDYDFQFRILVGNASHWTGAATTDIVSTPFVHKVRVSWESAIRKQSATEFFDYRQQPFMSVANDKLWLHLAGADLDDDSYCFVMDKRGEWTSYKNLDAMSMGEVEGRYGSELHRRFMIGKRFQRDSGYTDPFFIETEEWADEIFLRDTASYGLAQTGKLWLGHPLLLKRLRHILMTYSGGYNSGSNDEVSLIWASSNCKTPTVSHELPYSVEVDSEIIDTDRMCPQNYGRWFQFTTKVSWPYTRNHGIKLAQLMPMVVPMTWKATSGQVYVPPGGPPV